MKKAKDLFSGFLMTLLFFVSVTESRSQCINIFPYNEGFETGPTWTVTGTNSDWAWGTPAHPTINTAGGGTKSWCVGGLTGSFYNYSEQAGLYSPCFNFSTLNWPWISLKIFWEDEWRWDGLVLQSSINGGATWQNVGAFGDPVDCNTANWYTHNNITWLNSIPAAQRHGWCGRAGPTVGSCQGGNGSTGWVTAKHCLVGLANQPNVLFRLLFGSGTTCNAYDGIAIDDIHISNGIPNVANFSVACTGAGNFNFTAINAPCPVPGSWSWNFGDPGSGPANTSTSQTPSHVFSAPGTYSVTLIVTGGQCNPPDTVTQTITVSNISNAVMTQSILCFGGNTGSASVTAVSGPTPFTYTWSPSGGNSSSATNLTAGTYTVSVKDGNGCVYPKPVTITQPTSLTATPLTTNVLCNGGSTGSATVTAAGGTPGYSYTWSPSGGNSSTASNLTVGTYTVLVKDANSCTTTAVANITQPPALSASIGSSNATCGMLNGSATVTPAGGSPGYTYNWSPSGGTSSVASGLGAGNYTVLVTDVKGCTITANTTISQPVSMTISITSNSVQCFGGATGSALVSVSGGNAPYSYTWSPSPGGGQGTANATGLTAQTYTVHISDNLGCSTVAIASITQPASAVTAAITTSSVLCFGGATGSATVTAGGGTPGYTYSWNPTGATSTSINNLTAGTYTAIVRDANNCSVTAVANVTQPASAVTAAVNSSSILCFGGATGSATVTAGGGTPGYTYSWSPTGATSASINNLTVGTYTVLVKDANNCTVTAVATITQPASALSLVLNSTNASCGMSNGSATVNPSGGTPGYSYTWTPSGGNSAIASGLSMGNYSVSVADANNCRANGTVFIAQPSTIGSSISATSVSCFGGTNGTSSVSVSGGTGPFTYSWSPGPGSGQGTSAVSGLSSQNYSVIVTDALGCFTVSSISINQPTALNANITSTNVSCNGLLNGAAHVSVSGGTGAYSYLWSPSGGSSSLASGIGAGNYTVTIKDANNCSLTSTVTILEPTALSATLNTTNITCNGLTNGSASVSVTGGTASYSYTWLPTGGGLNTVSNLAAGTHTLKVSDANNCTTTQTFVITQPSSIVLNKSHTNVTCYGGNNGTASVQASGGISPYTFSWVNPVSSSASVSNLIVGNYTCVVKDNNNCASTAVITITQPAQVVASTSNYTICSGSAANINANANGGVGPYTFNWNGGTLSGQNITVSPIRDTVFTLIVTDASGCNSAAMNSSITVYYQPTVSVSNNDSICSGKSVTLQATITGTTTATLNYLWSPGSYTTSSINVNPASTTVYTLSVSLNGLCPLNSLKQVTVVVIPGPVASVLNPNAAGCAPLCISFKDNSTTPTGTIISWGWNFTNGQSSIAKDPQVCFTNAGSYTGVHTVVNSFGCVNTVTFGPITVYPKPVADFNHAPIKPIVNIDQEVVFTDASWGAPIVSWNWYFMNTAQYTSTLQNPVFSYGEAGNYVVALVVKSNKGCSDTLLRPLVVGEDFGIYVPNAFTPNEDGINDVFEPKGFGIVKYELYIFDRWGEKVFHTQKFEEGWDGSYQGRGQKICEEAVYTWLITVTDVFGKAHELKGHVTLMK